ncbi:YIP1 family protein [Dokdonella sp.]|uniref:YIP1 family protein n=1 Tax=Dokdonella sp. TaxID=2291710 RepID=UPI001B01F6BB|nr:YIP1 family protein [Dokdonella sp.]MBO9664754.1 hypothetical protein [Dokdonella sp.]
MSTLRALLDTLLPAMARPSRSAAVAMEVWRAALLAWLLMVLVAAIFYVRYYTAVDYEWMHTLALGQAAAFGKLPPDAEAAMARFLSPAVMAPLATAGMALQQVLVLVALWSYLRLVSVLAGSRVSSAGCLGAACVALLPTALDSFCALAASFLESMATTSIERLNPLSADALVFRLSEQSVWQKPLAALSPTVLWSIAILFYWLRDSVRLRAAWAAALAVAPFAAVFAVWGLLVVLSSRV